MYLIKVLSFVWDLRFNVRACACAGWLREGECGLGDYQTGVYVPHKALFLVFTAGISQFFFFINPKFPVAVQPQCWFSRDMAQRYI